MLKFDSPLTNIHIASPCQADWNKMYGDDRKRFCSECKLNVYNLSGMTRDEAETLVMNAEGRLCVRFYKRADGSVITQDCPVGWARLKQRTKVLATAAFSLVMALLSGIFIVSLFSRQSATVGVLKIPFTTPMPTPMPLMGAVAIKPNTEDNSNYVKGEATWADGNFAIPKPTPKPRTNFKMGKMKSMAAQDETRGDS